MILAPLGLNDLLAQLRTSQTPVASTVHEPVGNPAGPGLWHHKGMQLPPYIQHVANHLRAQGHDESSAVHMAVGIVQNWAAGHDGKGRKVHPDVQAAAAKNIAEWERLKASTGGGKRFNPFHAPAGPGGGEFTSGGGGGGASKGAHAKAAAPAPAAAGHDHGHGKNQVRRHQLLQRAAADREKAHRLEAELKVLEQQLHAHQKAAAAAKKTKATVAKSKQKAPVHHHHGHHHHARKTQSLRHRISVLRSEISQLRSQADHLTAQAKAL